MVRADRPTEQSHQQLRSRRLHDDLLHGGCAPDSRRGVARARVDRIGFERNSARDEYLKCGHSTGLGETGAVGTWTVIRGPEVASNFNLRHSFTLRVLALGEDVSMTGKLPDHKFGMTSRYKHLAQAHATRLSRISSCPEPIEW